MLEVPSVLYQLPQLARHVDFFSVGSNDLTQYLLAVDRNNTRVAGLYNSYHPAVLSALYDIVKQAEVELSTNVGEDFNYVPLLGDRNPPLDYRN